MPEGYGEEQQQEGEEDAGCNCYCEGTPFGGANPQVLVNVGVTRHTQDRACPFQLRQPPLHQEGHLLRRCSHSELSFSTLFPIIDILSSWTLKDEDWEFIPKIWSLLVLPAEALGHMRISLPSVFLGKQNSGLC